MKSSSSPKPAYQRQRQRRLFPFVVLLLTLSILYFCFIGLDQMSLPTQGSLSEWTADKSKPVSEEAEPTLQQQTSLSDQQQSLDPLLEQDVDASHHSFTDFIPLARLPSHHLPTTSSSSPRLLIIGDVHGQVAELRALLTKAGFSAARGDHVVFAGDMISKGPDSPGVIALAMSIGASGVRGNHEDKVLLAWAEHERSKKKHHGSDGDSKALAVARSLTGAQRRWLARLPVILRLGSIPDQGPFVVVHAGLVPGVALEDQDSRAVMNMRTLVYPGRREQLGDADADADMEGLAAAAQPSDGREGRAWSEAWSAAQEALVRAGGVGVSVAYGHDAKTGLMVRKWTYGLDSGCQKGGQLTALVFEPGRDAKGKKAVVRRLVSVDCLTG